MDHAADEEESKERRERSRDDGDDMDARYVANLGQHTQLSLSWQIPQPSQPLRSGITPTLERLAAEARLHPSLGGSNNLSLLHGSQDAHSINDQESLLHSMHGQIYMGGTNPHLASNAPMDQFLLQHQLSTAGLGWPGYPSPFSLATTSSTLPYILPAAAGAGQSSLPSDTFSSHRIDAEHDGRLLSSEEASFFLNRDAAAAVVPEITTLQNSSAAAQSHMRVPLPLQQQPLDYQTIADLSNAWTTTSAMQTAQYGGGTAMTGRHTPAWLPEPLQQQHVHNLDNTSYAASTAMREERGGGYPPAPGQSKIDDEEEDEDEKKPASSQQKRIGTQQEDGSFSTDDHTLPAETKQGPPTAAAAPSIAPQDEDLPITEKLKKLPRPARSLSAYNIFFQQERKRMMEKLPAVSGEERTASSSCSSSSKKRSLTGIPFKEMGRAIGASWKELSEEEKQTYEEVAKVDKQRYEREMIVFDAKREELRRSHHQKRLESVESCAWANYCKEQDKKSRRRR